VSPLADVFSAFIHPKENDMKIVATILLLKRSAPIAATLLILIDTTLVLWQAYERVMPWMV
jgi:hypothetical protein